MSYPVFLYAPMFSLGGQADLQKVGDLLFGRDWSAEIYTTFDRRVDRYLDNFKSAAASILDVGCGSSGARAKHFAYVGHDVTATDIGDYQTVFDHFNGKRRPAAHEITFQLGDFLSLSLPPASFDLVHAVHLIHFYEDTEPFIEKMSALTKDGGITAISFKTSPMCGADDLPDSVLEKIPSQKITEPVDCSTLYEINPFAVIAQAKKHDLSVLEAYRGINSVGLLLQRNSRGAGNGD